MESVSLQRRGFLSGRARSTTFIPRPPWAVPEALFIERCTRCGDCIDACPTRILTKVGGGYPAVDFTRGECTFCGECASCCQPHALWREEADAPAWTLVARIGEACLAPRGVECRICGEACPSGAIRFRPRPGGVAQPSFDAARCTGCGACFAPCPVRAIVLEVDA